MILATEPFLSGVNLFRSWLEGRGGIAGGVGFGERERGVTFPLSLPSAPCTTTRTLQHTDTVSYIVTCTSVGLPTFNRTFNFKIQNKMFSYNFITYKCLSLSLLTKLVTSINFPVSKMNGNIMMLPTPIL